MSAPPDRERLAARYYAEGGRPGLAPSWRALLRQLALPLFLAVAGAASLLLVVW